MMSILQGPIWGGRVLTQTYPTHDKTLLKNLKTLPNRSYLANYDHLWLIGSPGVGRRHIARLAWGLINETARPIQEIELHPGNNVSKISRIKDSYGDVIIKLADMEWSQETLNPIFQTLKQLVAEPFQRRIIFITLPKIEKQIDQIIMEKEEKIALRKISIPNLTKDDYPRFFAHFIRSWRPSHIANDALEHLRQNHQNMSLTTLKDLASASIITYLCSGENTLSKNHIEKGWTIVNSTDDSGLWGLATQMPWGHLASAIKKNGLESVLKMITSGVMYSFEEFGKNTLEETAKLCKCSVTKIWQEKNKMHSFAKNVRFSAALRTEQ